MSFQQITALLHAQKKVDNDINKKEKCPQESQMLKTGY